MVKTKTWLGTTVDISHCFVCNKWLGTDNSFDDICISMNKGFEIIIGKCGHSFHGNCVSSEKCIICNKNWEPVDKINLGSSNWWLVEKFWITNFSSIEK